MEVNVLELVLPYLNGVDFVRIRAVSREWKTVIEDNVDNYLVQEYGPPPMYSPGHPAVHSKLPLWCRLDYIQSMEYRITHPEAVGKRHGSEGDESIYLQLAEDPDPWRTKERKKNKYYLVRCNWIPNIERAMSYGCELNTSMANKSMDLAMMQFFADQGILPDTVGLIINMRRNKLDLVQWMIEHNVKPQYLKIQGPAQRNHPGMPAINLWQKIHIDLNAATRWFLANCPNIPPQIVQIFADRAVNDFYLVRNIYDKHGILPEKEICLRNIPRSSVEDIQWYIEHNAYSVEDLFVSAGVMCREDILRNIYPPPNFPLTDCVCRYGNARTLDLILTMKERLTVNEINIVAYLGKVDMMAVIIQDGYALTSDTANIALSAPNCTPALMTCLADSGCWPSWSTVARVYMTTKNKEIVQWIKSHYRWAGWF